MTHAQFDTIPNPNTNRLDWKTNNPTIVLEPKAQKIYEELQFLQTRDRLLQNNRDSQILAAASDLIIQQQQRINNLNEHTRHQNDEIWRNHMRVAELKEAIEKMIDSFCNSTSKMLKPSSFAKSKDGKTLPMSKKIYNTLLAALNN